MTVLLGKSAIGANTDGGNFDFCILSRFQCTATGTVTSLKFRVGVNAGTFLRLALYSDNAGVVEHVLAQGTAAPTANTWETVSGLSVWIVKDTYYWLGVKLDGCFTWDAGNRAYVAYPGDVAFVDHPAGLSYDNNSLISMYADGTEPYGVTVNAVTAAASAAAPAPAVSVVFNLEIAATTSAATADSPAPAISTTYCIEIVSVPMAASAAVPVPFAINGDAEVVPDPMTAGASVPQPSINNDIAGEIMTAGAAHPAPAIDIGAGVAAPTMTISATFPTPDVYVVQAQSEAVLVGERLEVIHDPAITSATVAGYVAIAVLAKARLDGKKGQITTPPHCGLELWDVVSAFDNVANQNTNYRVSGYTFEYDTFQGNYRHILDLCAV